MLDLGKTAYLNMGIDSDIGATISGLWKRPYVIAVSFGSDPTEELTGLSTDFH